MRAEKKKHPQGVEQFADSTNAQANAPKQEQYITLTSTVALDETTEEISKIFDYNFCGTVSEQIPIPTFPKDFQIGLIVGSSGSGKSTLLKRFFGEEEKVVWDNSKCIASNFGSFEEASSLFGAVGLNSIPTWCKPYRVLSNGEKFRADVARRLKDGAVIDEFTSVVNREVAKSCSCSISKYIRNAGLKNVVFASCHADIIPYLEPTWVYDTDEHEFHNGKYLRQPIVLEVHPCDRALWSMFKRYHYLSAELNEASKCFVGLLNKRPIAFVAVLPLPGMIKHAFKEHRLVVHPDYQGMGIGNKLSEMIAEAYVNKGCRYFSKTANPRVGSHRDRSELWKGTAHNHSQREDYMKNGVPKTSRYSMNANGIAFHASRVCYCHEYVGNGVRKPFTLDLTIGSSKEVDGQISFFDGR